MSDDLPRGTSETSETARRVPDSAYDTWLTKAQAAAAIGRSEKAVQRLAADGQIQQASCQAQGRGPFRTVYEPTDVARIASERHPGLQAFVLPVGVTAPSNGNGHADTTALQIASPEVSRSGQELMQAFAVALQTVSRTSRTPPTYVDRPTALALAGVSDAELRKAVNAGEVRQRGRGYRRRDLEAL